DGRDAAAVCQDRCGARGYRRLALPRKTKTENPRTSHYRRSEFWGQVTVTAGKAMGIEEVRTAARSPWQNAYVERLIASVRRECLDHIIVLNAAGLRTILKSYVTYDMDSPTHRS